MSLPASSPVSPAASAAAEPPEEPPGVRATSHGLLVVPYTALKLCQSASIRGTLVLAKSTTPAPSRRSTASAFRPGRLSLSSGDPHVVGMPTTSYDSLM